MQKQRTLTEGNVISTLIYFALPFLAANLLQACYGAADLLIVGQFGDSAGVSAVAVGSQIMQMITVIILGLTTGGTVLIGQYLGANKPKDIAKTIGTMICIFGIAAVGLTIIMLALNPVFPQIMRTPSEAVEYTKQYILICTLGIPFIIGYNVTSGIFRGLGDSKSPLYFIGIACVVNIVADIVLVKYFHMGAAGAAIATISAQGISFIAAFLTLRKKGFPFPFTKDDVKLSPMYGKKIIRLGLPISIQDALITISFLIIMAIINTMGLTASASVGVVEKVIAFSMLIPQSFSAALAVITAQNIGAGKPERARKSLYGGITCSLIFGIAFFCLCQIIPTFFTGIFTADKEVVEMSAVYLKSYSLDCVLVCLVFCMNSFFSGSGHPMFPMVHSLAATFAIRVPMSYMLSKVAGVTLYEIGFAAPTATLLSAIACIIYMKSGSWKKNTILEEALPPA